jgi:hypothetical protein
MRTALCIALGLVVVLSAAAQERPANGDRDGDGIADQQEQELLEKFRPRLLVSAADCDSVPAEFEAGSEMPRPVARNGTIYGQVFAHAAGPEKQPLLEIHYYHLWARDCDLTGHPLDAEHVSVLVTGDPSLPITAWRAVAWYAAAHQDTLCDRSTAARASALGAEDRGVEVWVSQGKHASFLRPADCAHGCGQDRCGDTVVLSPGPIFNIGEPGRPLNGALWAGSRAWPLAEKMKTDFPPELLARLANTESEVRATGSLQHAQPVISAGGASVEAVASSGDQVSAAVSRAGGQTHSALGSGVRGVGNALKRTGSFIGSAWPRAKH